MRILILFTAVFLSATLFVGAGVYAQDAKLNIGLPSSGELSQKQLAAIAGDIHRLESNPLAPDATQAAQALFKWLIESPDVSMKMCAGVTTELVQSKSPHHAALLLQFMLSSAAYAIDHPDHAGDNVMLHVGGLKGATAAYALIKAAEGDSAKDSFMEKVLKLIEEGGLDVYVREKLEDC